MQAPLQCKSYDIDGHEHLEIWCNGEKTVLPSPVKPFFISLKPLVFECTCYPPCQTICFSYTVTEGDGVLLDSLEEVHYWKYTFDSVERIREINRQLKRNPEYEAVIRENHIPFVERVAIDAPEFFANYEEKLENKLTLDIETLSKRGRFYKEIIAISLNHNGETWCITGPEEEILTEFIDQWRRINPDLIIGYNLKGFDLPRILERCEYHNLPLDWYNRDGSRITRNTPNCNIDAHNRAHRIVGRSIFDVWESVHDDQTLSGKTKDRKLKTIAHYFKIPAILEDTSDTDSLSHDDLVKYCNSDVDATVALFDKYFYAIYDMANHFHFPFDEFANTKGSRRLKNKEWDKRGRGGFSTLVTRLVMAGGMSRKGYIENGVNRDRFDAYRYGKAFQGAYVDSFQHGVFHYVMHTDVASLYPSTVESLNISPDTIKLLAEEPLDPNADFVVNSGDSGTTFCVPDANYKGGRNLIIWVDYSHEGILSEFVRITKADRAESKTEMKKFPQKSKEYLFFYSQQWAKKVRMNSCGFGTMTPGSERYASLLCGNLTTGFGRRLMGGIVKPFLEERGINPIELDTDGIYSDWGKEEIPTSVVEELNARIADWMSGWCYTNTIKMELTMWRDAFFRFPEVGKEKLMKSYILRGKYSKGKYGNNIKFTGASYMNKIYPPFIDRFRDGMAKLILDEVPDSVIADFIEESMDISRYNLSDIVKHVSLGKKPEEYKGNCEQMKVARIYQRRLGIEPEQGASYKIVYGPDREIIPVILASIDDIDHDHYRNMIVDMSNRFNCEVFAKRIALQKKNKTQRMVTGLW